MSAESRRLHPAPASFCVSACASRASLASGSRATLPRTRRARLHERHIRAQRGVWQAQQQRSSCMCSLRCDEVRTATARATATRASHSMPFVRQHAAIESAQPRDARSVTLAFLARTQVHYPAATNYAARPDSRSPHYLQRHGRSTSSRRRCTSATRRSASRVRIVLRSAPRDLPRQPRLASAAYVLCCYLSKIATTM